MITATPLDDRAHRRLLRTGRPNLDADPWLRISVACFPLFAVVLTLGLKVAAPASYSQVIEEDGIVEWGTALAFLAAGCCAAALAAQLRRDGLTALAVLYAGLTAGMIFAMIEEISWGQRLFGIQTPEFFTEHNTKNELNLHNLEQFRLGWVFIALGFYGSFARVLAGGGIRRRFPAYVELLTPRAALAAYFLVTFALYAYFEYIYYTLIRPLGITVRREYDWAGHFIIGKDQEAAELLLAIGFLLFAFDNWQRYRAAKGHASPSDSMGAGPQGLPKTS